MMSAKCPLICSAVELWYKMMLEIRNQSDLTENHIKRKAAGYQRLSSNWLWLFMAVYKPSLPDAIFPKFSNMKNRNYAKPYSSAEYNIRLAHNLQNMALL